MTTEQLFAAVGAALLLAVAVLLALIHRAPPVDNSQDEA